MVLTRGYRHIYWVLNSKTAILHHTDLRQSIEQDLNSVQN